MKLELNKQDQHCSPVKTDFKHELSVPFPPDLKAVMLRTDIIQNMRDHLKWNGLSGNWVYLELLVFRNLRYCSLYQHSLQQRKPSGVQLHGAQFHYEEEDGALEGGTGTDRTLETGQNPPPLILTNHFFLGVSEAVMNSAFMHTLLLMYIIHNPVLTQVTQIHNQSENMSLSVHYLHYELLKMRKTVHHFGGQTASCRNSRCSDERIRLLSFGSPFHCECWHRYPSQIPLWCPWNHFYGSPEQPNTGESDLKRLTTAISAQFSIPVDC